MDQYRMMQMLGKAFTEGKIDALAPLLTDDCGYVSEYANKSVSGAEAILERMKSVYSCIDDTCAYTCKIVSLEDVMIKGMTLRDLDDREGMCPCEYGLLLYQYDACKPVAVVVCMMDRNGKFKSIHLSRDKGKFDLTFYGDEIEYDSPDDLPSTVTPFTPHDRLVKELRSAVSGQHLDDPREDTPDLYIWRKADEFVKDWLPSIGYTVLESAVFEDCIGYRCNRNNYAYTVFMYAYGKKKASLLDGDYCRKLADLPFAQKSTILIVYLNVKRYMEGTEIKYKVRNYCGSDEYAPELWRLSSVNGKTILQYYPRKEMIDVIDKLMYAFNREDTDIYDCIICDQNPSVTGCTKHAGPSLNEAFYQVLRSVHQKYGNMKIGYVRYNDVIYSACPYVDDVGFFSFRVDNATDRIQEVTCHPFDGGEGKVAEFIKTEEREPDDLFDFIPRLIKAVPLAPVPTERFSAKLFFENGECRKYVLPIKESEWEQEVVSYMHHVFTDGIWSSVSVAGHHKSRYRDYPECGPAIAFKNGFLIAATRCYEESVPYSKPQKCGVIVYSDHRCQLRKLWSWDVSSLYEDDETGLLKVLISGQAFNWGGKSTFAAVDGTRMTSLAFDYIDDFEDGLARAAISGYGFGFVDRDMNLVIPLKYDNAENFHGGKARVRLGERWLFIDKSGKEIPLDRSYQEVCDYREGMSRVSTLKLRLMDLAYHSDYNDIAGIWGFVNEAGEEVIPPQYIYAHDFEDGIAIVARGKWTIDKKWDNEYNKGRYWTEEELWGGIDKKGNEVIPCIFDEIKFFFDCSDAYIAHYGGWENGRWGVIDRTGKWLAEPIFEDIDYEYQDGLFAFYAQDQWSDPDNVPMGIYDIKQHKVIFEPQFSNVGFRENDDIEVEVFDPELDRTVEKIIDRTGKERFKSIYSSIYAWKDPYEAEIRDENGSRHGLIDRSGKVLLPCKYDVAWDGISYEKRRIIFVQDGKQGVLDFEDHIIVPAEYYEIRGLDDPLLTVRVGEKDHYQEGLLTQDGHTVLPAIYRSISWLRDKKGVICRGDGSCEFYQFETH